jgi:hypothetical protein
MADDPNSPESKFQSDPHDHRFDAHMAALGHLSAIWASLEFQINQAIWELCNIERGTGACVTAQIVAPVGRMRALISLIHYRGANPFLIGKFNKFSQRVDSLARQRNRYIHDTWTISPTTGEVYRVHVTADRELQFGFQPTSVEQLTTLFLEIQEAIIRFDDLYKSARAELPPWPRTQYEQSPGIHASPLAQDSASQEPPPPPEPSQE